mgnify:FL=1
MGLVKAALGAASGVMGDQWKEYFTCSALPADVLAVKGEKKQSGRSANRHGSENIITDGSIVAVAEGQCALIVEQGKVVDLCAEPGEYTYNTGTQPSLLSGGLAKNIDDAFAEMGKRFAFGGQEATDQRIYYINTKELPGNKYGTPSPVPFRVVDQRAGIDMDISIRCFGEYSYRITNPILFYTNVCGNVENAYLRETLDSQLKTELLTALQPAFAKISEQGIVSFDALPLGLYLVVQTENSKGYEAINSFLVSLPMADESGWLYTVDATPKVGAPTQEVTPPEPETPSKPSEPDKPSEPEKPSEPDKPTQPGTPDEPDNPDMPVDPNDPNRPVSPGTPDNPVNPGNPDNPVAPGRPDGNALPQSGQLNWPIPFMACSGVLLFAVGWVLDRKEMLA